MPQSISRRDLVITTGVIAGTGLAGCTGRQSGKDGDDAVTANEDLMREHGIIRRALLVYSEISRRARMEPASIPLPSLLQTATLFREFAEDYHERDLEEAHIFPVVRKLASPAAQLPDILLAQHQRGREITNYVRQVAQGVTVATSEADRLASALDALVAMYGPHAAREDTELFPAWRAALGDDAYREMGERFEEVEHRRFGRDGFDVALGRIVAIEEALGMGDLARVTAPPIA